METEAVLVIMITPTHIFKNLNLSYGLLLQPMVKCISVFQKMVGQSAVRILVPAGPTDQVLVAATMFSFVDDEINNPFFNTVLG
jgi:hypothetical protein